MKLETLETEVEFILTTEESARADDMTLYLKYLELHDASLVETFNSRTYRLAMGLSSYGSVSRCRRRLQEKYSELKPSEATLKLRKEEEKRFKAYARNENTY